MEMTMSKNNKQPNGSSLASCAWRITCSPHEWTWTQEEQEAMARAVVEMSDRIHRASVAFCGDKSDGEAAAEMFRILSEVNKWISKRQDQHFQEA